MASHYDVKKTRIIRNATLSADEIAACGIFFTVYCRNNLHRSRCSRMYRDSRVSCIASTLGFPQGETVSYAYIYLPVTKLSLPGIKTPGTEGSQCG